jgi:hypothetical protein
MLPSAPATPVAIWHDLNFSGYLVSEIGPITGTPTADLHSRHCTNRDFCTVIHHPFGRCLLFSIALLDELDAGSCRYHNLRASRHTAHVVELHADHVGLSAAQTTSWTYRLLPLRWRNTDPPGHTDPNLQLGIWPD